MLWLCLIFCSPPTFCRTLFLLWDLNLTHSPILKDSRSSFWKQKDALKETNVMHSSQTSCGTITGHAEQDIHRDCVPFWAHALLFALTLPSFSCPLVSPLVSLSVLNLSPSPLSAKWLPLAYRTHRLKHGSAMTYVFLFQHLLNCAPVPHSLERESHLPILLLFSLPPVQPAMMTRKDSCSSNMGPTSY